MKKQVTRSAEQIIRQLNKIKKPSREALEDISAIVRFSIRDNLKARGRWDGDENEITIFSSGSQKWKPLAESTKKRYAKKGISPLKPTLRVTGDLERSIDIHGANGEINIVVKNPYAAIHQFGGKINHPGGTAYGFDKKDDYGKLRFLSSSQKMNTKRYLYVGDTKPHIIEIPARPYVVIHDEDIEEIQDVIVDDLVDQIDIG